MRLASYTHARLRPIAGAGRFRETVDIAFTGDATMGKYFLAWLLGVPGIVLLLLYFFFR